MLEERPIDGSDRTWDLEDPSCRGIDATGRVMKARAGDTGEECVEDIIWSASITEVRTRP